MVTKERGEGNEDARACCNAVKVSPVGRSENVTIEVGVNGLDGAVDDEPERAGAVGGFQSGEAKGARPCGGSPGAGDLVAADAPAVRTLAGSGRPGSVAPVAGAGLAASDL